MPASKHGVMSQVGLVVIAVTMLVVATMGCLFVENSDDHGPHVPLDRRGVVLTIDGMVTSPGNMTMSELIALGVEDFEATLIDADGSSGTATYEGIRLLDVLELHGAGPGAEVIRIRSANSTEGIIFLSDVSNGTYIVIKKDGEWLGLDTDGPLMFVDKNLDPNYRASQVVSLTLDRSMSVVISGLANNTEPLSAAYVHLNGEAMTWTYGEWNVTGRGISFVSILERIDVDMRWGTIVDFIREGQSVPMATQDFMGADRYFLTESGGGLSLVRNNHIWIAPFDTINVTPGIRMTSDTGGEWCMTLDGIMDLPSVVFLHGGRVWTGASLESVIAAARLPSGPDALEVLARDGRSVVLPRRDIPNATIVHTMDGIPLGSGEGYLIIMDPTRPTCYTIEGILAIRAYNSIPIKVDNGVYPPIFNASAILTIGFIGDNASRSVTIVGGDLDGEYRAVAWDDVVHALSFDTNATLYVNGTTRDGNVHHWMSLDLVGRADNGLAVDHLGRYVAVPGGDGEVAIDVVAIEVKIVGR